MKNMKSITRCTRLAAVTLALLAMAGCASFPMFWGPDPASGEWEGDWYVQGNERPLGVVRATVERVSKDEWRADFYAEFGGGFGNYESKLVGHREGNAIVFAGAEDLGETEGGIFTFTSRVENDEFLVDYSALAYKGTVVMTRVE